MTAQSWHWLSSVRNRWACNDRLALKNTAGSSSQSVNLTVPQNGKLLQASISMSTRSNPAYLFLVLHVSLRHPSLARAALVLEELLLALLGGSLLQGCQPLNLQASS